MAVDVGVGAEALHDVDLDRPAVVLRDHAEVLGAEPDGDLGRAAWLAAAVLTPAGAG